MIPIMPQKKPLTTKIRQPLIKYPKSVHYRNTSMFQVLGIKGNCTGSPEQQKDHSRPQMQSRIIEKSLKIDEFINKEFFSLKDKIQRYCQEVNRNSRKLNDNEKSVKETYLTAQNELTQESVFYKLVNKIHQYIKQLQIKSPKKFLSPQVSETLLNFSLTDKLPQSSEKIADIQVLNLYRTSLPNYIQNKSTYEIKASDQVNFMQNIRKQPQIYKQHSKVQSNSLEKKENQNNFISGLPYSCSSGISQILYKQAKVRTFSQFNDICQRILLEKKPIISDFHFLKKEKIQLTNYYLSQIFKKLSLLNTQLRFFVDGQTSTPKAKRQISFSFYEEASNQSIGQDIEQICLILKKLNEVHKLNSLIFACPRPCCQFQPSNLHSQTKAKILINLKKSAKHSLTHYKTTVTENYFNRYYNKQDFDKKRIYSLSKTKTEQMQQLQKSYLKNKQNAKPCKKRCKSLLVACH